MIQLDGAPLTKGFHGRGHVWMFGVRAVDAAAGRRVWKREAFSSCARGVKSSYRSMQLAHNDESATAGGSLLKKKKKKIMIDQATTTTTGQGRGEEN